MLQKASVWYKINKCFFFHDKIPNLGNEISPGALEVATSATDAEKALKIPTNVTEVRSFMDFCIALCRFVPDLTRISATINQNLHKGQPNKLYSVVEELCTTIATPQEKLLKPPVLGLPKRRGRYTIDRDACDRQV